MRAIAFMEKCGGQKIVKLTNNKKYDIIYYKDNKGE